VSAEFLQFLFSGLTVGAIYALVGLGFSIIYNASQVINFAQGEFVMIGGMATVFFLGLGVPMPVAVVLAVLVAVVVGVLFEKLAVEPARDAPIVTLIIITIGASIFLRGAAQVIWGRNFHSVPAFTGSEPIIIGGAAVLPQSLWIIGSMVVIVAALQWFFTHTMIGKAIIATSHNPFAARLVGINTRFVLMLGFALAALLGATAGILVAPISLTYAGVGVMLGLKGFSAAVLGGLGRPMGAIAGGLMVGISEAMTAGYLSSAYKDAVAFVIILLVLFFMPSGLFGARGTERV
jgi:branched-chain amino acid transport system permease protein